MLLSKKYTPRWIVFIIDVFISVASVALAYLLRFNFEIPDTKVASLFVIIPFVALVRITSFIIGRTYTGIVRYTGIYDAQRIFITVFLGSVFIGLANIISFHYITHAYIVPFSILIIDFFTTVIFMTSLRWLVKAVFNELSVTTLIVKRAAIYGAGPMAIAAKNTLEQEPETKYKIVTFFDDVSSSSRKQLEGVPLSPISSVDSFLSDNVLDFLVLARPFDSIDEKTKLIELSLANNIQVLTVPSVEGWIDGVLKSKQIRQIKIEELLERSPIKLDKVNIQKQISGKVVLITGAAGSIGSEMVRQIIKYNPLNLILFDQAETPLYDIEMELSESQHQVPFQIIIGNVADAVRVDEVFGTYKPDFVFHAAAYKHVPMMEKNPAEAIKNNVLGTKVLADVAMRHHTKKFVMVSTDKAVNPTNVMGASKRIAEIYVQSLSGRSSTIFMTTRFGNVLGSNGSVIPRFRKQIAEGGPVTVTHPDITRYFMTIPEACQLVLEAGVIGTGGAIYLFDMGKSVKIDDLAKKMIKLSGLKVGKDIQVIYTGLRPGEKLYEELLADKENTLPTHHAQIMIAKTRTYDFDVVNGQITDLLAILPDHNNRAIVKSMKHIVPEFISQNSVYEELDT